MNFFRTALLTDSLGSSLMVGGFFALIIGIAFFVGVPMYLHNLTKKENQDLLRQGKPIRIDLSFGHYYGGDVWCNGVSDSAGGWDIRGSAKNICNLTINYIYVYVLPIDRVGYPVAPAQCFKVTGPIEPGQKQTISCKHLWYDLPVHSIAIEKITFLFADGRQSTVDYLNNQPKPNFSAENKPTATKQKPVVCSIELGHYGDNGTFLSGMPDRDGWWYVHPSIENKSDHIMTAVLIHACPVDKAGTKYTDNSICFRCNGPFFPAKRYGIKAMKAWRGAAVNTAYIEKIVLKKQDGSEQTLTGF